MEAAQVIEAVPEAAEELEELGDPVSLDGLEVDPRLGYKVHPFADAFPMMEGAEFDELVEDIRRNGLVECVEYIEHHGEKIVVDGRNRLLACIAAKVEPRFWKRSATGGDDLLAYVWSKNVHRRQLTPSQRAMIATEHQAFIDAITKSSAQRRKATQGRPKKGAKKTQRKVAPSKKTAAVVAESAKVSTRTMEHAIAVKKSGDVKLISEVKAGRKSVSKAAKEARDAKQKPPTPAAKKVARTSLPKKAVTKSKDKVPSNDAAPDATAVLADFIDFILACRKEFKSDFNPELSVRAEQLEKDLRHLSQRS